MEGINYVTDDKNQKIAVLIDLRKYGELWEEFYDVLIANMRKEDEKLSWEEAKQILKKEGKL